VSGLAARRHIYFISEPALTARATPRILDASRFLSPRRLLSSSLSLLSSLATLVNWYSHIPRISPSHLSRSLNACMVCPHGKPSLFDLPGAGHTLDRVMAASS
jgi:hypothetical protein